MLHCIKMTHFSFHPMMWQYKVHQIVHVILNAVFIGFSKICTLSMNIILYGFLYKVYIVAKI